MVHHGACVGIGNLCGAVAGGHKDGGLRALAANVIDHIASGDASHLPVHDRQVELAKAIFAAKCSVDGDVDEEQAMGESMSEAATMMEQITAALTAPKVVIRDEMGNVVGAETVLDG